MITARAASTVARSARNWADCSVYVKIFPRPRNIAESKEVLRVLQRYGEVVMYRHLRNAALAIYRTESSAKIVINASPIRFQVERGSDGWVSKISQDASSQDLGVVSSSNSDAPLNDDSDQSIHEGSSSKEIDNGPQEDTLQDKLEHQARYPFEDSPEIEGNALIRPEKWGSRYLNPALQPESNASRLTKDTPDTETPQNNGGSAEKKRVKKSAQRLAEDLGAALKSSVPTQRNVEKGKPLAPIKEFELTVVQSILNHQAHIERQAYYAGFNPDMKTIMAEDLKGRVPMDGLLDCNLNKPEVPLRFRLRRKETARSPSSLMELWQRGRRDRGEV
ncbi:MAG: hypothetical protein LQ343_005984 [Gyalolechia ehrenbergii]|nr:MAG: hypothetical protein LQ343_005984 [Gyalolechia ehrenbergii]